MLTGLIQENRVILEKRIRAAEQFLPKVFSPDNEQRRRITKQA